MTIEVKVTTLLDLSAAIAQECDRISLREVTSETIGPELGPMWDTWITKIRKIIHVLYEAEYPEHVVTNVEIDDQHLVIYMEKETRYGESQSILYIPVGVIRSERPLHEALVRKLSKEMRNAERQAEDAKRRSMWWSEEKARLEKLLADALAIPEENDEPL